MQRDEKTLEENLTTVMERAQRPNIAHRHARLLMQAAVCVQLAFFAVGCAKRLTIRSEPSGADVSLNDVVAGKTPLEVNLADMPQGASLKILLKKPDYGSFTGYIPGPTSSTLSSEIDIVIPKVEDDSERLNRQIGIVRKAQRLALQKKGAEAVKLLDDALKEYPRFTSLTLAKANVLFLAKNYDGALAEYRKVLQLEPTNDEAITMVAFFKKRSLAGNPAAVPAATPATGAKP